MFTTNRAPKISYLNSAKDRHRWARTKWPRGAMSKTASLTCRWIHCLTLAAVFNRLDYHIPVELRSLIFEFAKPILPYVVSIRTLKDLNHHNGGYHYFRWQDRMDSLMVGISYWRPPFHERTNSVYLKDMVGPRWHFTMVITEGGPQWVGRDGVWGGGN